MAVCEELRNRALFDIEFTQKGYPCLMEQENVYLFLLFLLCFVWNRDMMVIIGVVR